MPRMPATYTGVLPCADCEGVRWHLDLLAGHGYELEREWLGRGTVRDELGYWSIDPARNALVLRGAGEMPLQFAIAGADRLRLLDMDGRPIDSKLPYELVTDGTLKPADLHLTLGGEMVYMADAASFTECLTGQRFPIAMEGDYLALERAYTSTASPPGSPLYVSFEGAIVPRPKMEGEGTERTVVVERFINAWPGQRCERARADAALANTWWRLVRLGSTPVEAADGRREAHIVLRDADGGRSWSASVGCNSLAGGYAQDGDSIRFSAGATTLMACPPALAADESELSRVLQSARRWKVTASQLELFDGAGAPLALFEAVYF